MGEKKLRQEIVTMEELIEAKYFDSVEEIYAIPDSSLPRLRRNGKIVRPLRFYWRDVDKLFSTSSSAKNTNVASLDLEAPRPMIAFKKRRK